MNALRLECVGAMLTLLPWRAQAAEATTSLPPVAPAGAAVDPVGGSAAGDRLPLLRALTTEHGDGRRKTCFRTRQGGLQPWALSPRRRAKPGRSV